MNCCTTLLYVVPRVVRESGGTVGGNGSMDDICHVVTCCLFGFWDRCLSAVDLVSVCLVLRTGETEEPVYTIILYLATFCYQVRENKAARAL